MSLRRLKEDRVETTGKKMSIEEAIKLPMFAIDKYVLRTAYTLGLEDCYVELSGCNTKETDEPIYRVTKQFVFMATEAYDKATS